MTNWQPLFETDLVPDQDWVISSNTTALEFRLEQTNVPSLGLFAIAQILDPVTEEYIDIKNVPAKAGNTRLVLNPLQYASRQIGVKFRYAEWPGEPQLWHVVVYYNADVDQSANPVSIVVDVLPRLIGAEPLGAAATAKAEAIAAAQAMIDALPLEGGNFEPLGAAATAKAEAIAYTDTLVDSLLPEDVEAISVAEKGQPLGVATLGADGLVPAVQLPPSSGSGGGLTTQQVVDLINSYLDPSQTKFWSQATVINGNSLAMAGDVSNEYYSVFRQNPGSFSDEIELNFYLPTGNYFLILIANKTSSSGRQQVIFQNPDGGSPTIIGENDLYSASSQRNVWHYMTFSSTTPGKKTFRFKMVGQSAGSSGYFAEVSRVRVFKQS